MNQCIHGIDLLRWMMGDEVEEVYGATCQQFHDYLEAEDVGMAVVKFRNGAIGTIEGSVNVYPKNLEETLYLFGETGTVKIGGTSTNDIDVWDFADGRDDGLANGLKEETSNVYGNGHTQMCIRDSRAAFPCRAGDGRSRRLRGRSAPGCIQEVALRDWADGGHGCRHGACLVYTSRCV